MRRLFAPSVVQQLGLIALGRAGGFSLEEIREMFGPDGQLHIKRDRLLAKAEELDKSARRLTAIRDTLRHAAACPARSHMECPQFVRLLRLAGARR